ncbi:MAG TPA: ATP-dependent zinc metalloprotease FtsH [bacterium]|nr:ATP-dependent zinc metalloprotease FtsH [bacterium]
MTVQQNPNKFSKYSFLVILLISVLALSYVVKNPLGVEEKKLTYSEFLSQVETKQITEVVIVNQQNKLKGTTSEGTKFYVDAPKDEDLIKTLRSNGVQFSAENPGIKENAMQFVAMIIVPVIVLIAIWFLIMRQAQAGGSQAMSFGRSKAKMLTDNAPQVNFNDVAGVDEAVEELREVVDFLKNPKRFQDMGAKIPRGVLLLGPPGSGKTLLARAIAGEAKVPFFHMSGSDFVEMFVGVGASRVRDLFDQAKKTAPCLVFVDEIDAVGRQRGAGLGGGHDEREQTLNQLLVEMDGFDPNLGVIVIAATNRPDVLDPALLRPGRFDRRVVVDRPDLVGREAILQIHSIGKPIDEAVDLSVIARRTPGFTGADLSNMLNEAAILAAREGTEKVLMRHIEEAIDRTIAGPERRSRLLSDKDKKVTAYHEVGHALIAKMLPDADPVHKVSILPRGMALGYTLQLPLEDKYTVPREELKGEICVLLGGRVAEKLVFDDISTGASNDIQRATKIARRMVMEFGMSDELGPIAFGRKNEEVFLGRDFSHERDYSEEIAAKIDAEVRMIVDGCYEKVKRLLSENMDLLELVAEELIKHELLEGVRLETLLNGENLSEEEIERLEEEKRKAEEEKNRRRLEEKEAKEREASEKEKTNDEAREETLESEDMTTAVTEMRAENEIKSSSGLISSFYSSLESIFRDLIEPYAGNETVRNNLDKLEHMLLESKTEFAKVLLLRLIRESDNKLIESVFRIRLAMLYARIGRLDYVEDELMSALNTGSDELEQGVKSTLVKAIGYFRIFDEELRISKAKFSSSLNDSGILEKVDKRYREWEEKTS